MDYQYRIREMAKSDIDRVLEIERLVFAHPWTKEYFVQEMDLNEFSILQVLELNINGEFKIVGFHDYWITFDSATIAQIGIDENYQRQGLGSILMKEIIRNCYAKRADTITLEVRKSNEKARKFYKKFKFEEITVKPHYYDNGEDAIYMVSEVIDYGEDFSN